MTTLKVTLAERETDVLVHLVDRGPGTAEDLANQLGEQARQVKSALYTLTAIGVVARDNGSPPLYCAKREGIEMVDRARRLAA